jgi:hypothetical protein
MYFVFEVIIGRFFWNERTFSQLVIYIATRRQTPALYLSDVLREMDLMFLISGVLQEEDSMFFNSSRTSIDTAQCRDLTHFPQFHHISFDPVL